MLADFYRELESSSIRHLFPRNMQRASEKSAAFFVGILGGPPLYHERYGNPAMRARHMPFVIDESRKQVWVDCFMRVLDHATERYNFPEEALPQFREFLIGFAGWMVNAANESDTIAEGFSPVSE
jgi:hemoglobin